MLDSQVVQAESITTGSDNIVRIINTTIDEFFNQHDLAFVTVENWFYNSGCFNITSGVWLIANAGVQVTNLSLRLWFYKDVEVEI